MENDALDYVYGRNEGTNYEFDISLASLMEMSDSDLLDHVLPNSEGDEGNDKALMFINTCMFLFNMGHNSQGYWGLLLLFTCKAIVISGTN